MHTNLIKTYSSIYQDILTFIANYRISRARRIIKNAFGILSARFRIFQRPILAKIDTVVSITKACVALHNFLMQDNDSGFNPYCPRDFVDFDNHGKRKPGLWRKVIVNDTGMLPIGNSSFNNYSKNAKEVRDMFRDYFNSEQGAVPWQWDIVKV